jgi:hypothetical protein
VRGAADEICRRWCHDDQPGFTRETNVIERVPWSEDLSVYGTAGDGLERDGANELARGAGHHHVNLGTGLCKQTRQPH